VELAVPVATALSALCTSPLGSGCSRVLHAVAQAPKGTVSAVGSVWALQWSVTHVIREENMEGWARAVPQTPVEAP